MSCLIKTGKTVVFAESQSVSADTLERIEQRLQSSGADGIVLGQFPCFDLGYVDPVSGECEVPNSNAFAVTDQCYNETGAEDRDLRTAMAADYAYRMRSSGKKIKLATDIILPVHTAPSVTQSWIDATMLRYKYASVSYRKKIIRSVIDHVIKYDPSLGGYSRKELISSLPAVFKHLLLPAETHKTDDDLPDHFMLANIRGSYTAEYKMPEDAPQVSLVLRTHKRPDVLRLTLENLRRLDYPNFEIVLIEDGEPSALGMVKDEFADLKIRYYATGDPVGRAAAANIGFRMAEGEWVNLIDDDDFFFPEHLSIGIGKALSEKKDMVFLQSLALEISSQTDPYRIRIERMHHMDIPRVDPFTMTTECKTSDNGVLFRKELLERAGYMREDLDAHEDWSLWLRLMTVADWTVIPYATCAFVNPYCEDEKKSRTEQYRSSDGKQFDDDILLYRTSAQEVKGYFTGALNDMEALLEEGSLDRYLKDYSARYDHLAREHKEEAFKEWTSLIADGEGGMFPAKKFHLWYCGMIQSLIDEPSSGRKELLSSWRSSYGT